MVYIQEIRQGRVKDMMGHSQVQAQPPSSVTFMTIRHSGGKERFAQPGISSAHSTKELPSKRYLTQINYNYKKITVVESNPERNHGGWHLVSKGTSDL